MRIGIAADHGGFELKVYLTTALKAAGYEVADFGAHELVTGDDYPDFVVPIKVPGVRAGLIADSFSAHQGVEDDDMNAMCLGGRVTGQALAWDLVQTFLIARFKATERFKRRLAKIADLESKTEL